MSDWPEVGISPLRDLERRLEQEQWRFSIGRPGHPGRGDLAYDWDNWHAFYRLTEERLALVRAYQQWAERP